MVIAGIEMGRIKASDILPWRRSSRRRPVETCLDTGTASRPAGLLPRRPRDMIEPVGGLVMVAIAHSFKYRFPMPLDAGERSKARRDETWPDEDRPDRPACPVCGGTLAEFRGKLVCRRCRTICETCCEGGRG